MDILLVAYDFPPVPSPQSLRWAYLARELSAAGHRVRVITPDQPGYGPGGLPVLPQQVEILRVYPGRFTTFLNRAAGGWRRRVRPRVPEVQVEAEDSQSSSAAYVASPAAVELNWKGRLRHRLERLPSNLLQRTKSIVSARMYPDYRAEWVPFAAQCLEQAVLERRPDVVVASHEPACSLPVGLVAARLGVPLVCDMGDPVFAPYTPERWRKQAFQLEARVCATAAMVSVTSVGAAALLRERHGLDAERTPIIRQGFDPEFVAEKQDRLVKYDPQRLELLYTGSFYDSRRADAILRAIRRVEGVRLTVATIVAPDYLLDAARQAPESVRIAGYLPHRAALAAQRDCDVLVNLANADPVQIPGKVYEYLGAARPLLHIRGSQPDGIAALLESTSGGWDVSGEENELVGMLRRLMELKVGGELVRHAPKPESVVAYSWRNLASDWAARVERSIGGPTVKDVRDDGR